MIIETIKEGIKSREKILEIPGKYSRQNMRVLRALARAYTKFGSYLEIGVYKGSSLLNVADAVDPGVQCFGIENFSQFENTDGISTFAEWKMKHNLFNAHLEEADFEFYLSQPNKHKLGIAYIDGPHDYRSQLVALLLLKKHMAPQSVIVIDDVNYPHVRQATKDFLVSHPEWILAYETYTPAHPENEPPMAGYNGMHVLVKGEPLPKRMLPPCGDRDQFLSDHYVHSHRHAHEVTKALQLINTISFYKPRKYKLMNTDSEGLKTRFNENT